MPEKTPAHAASNLDLQQAKEMASGMVDDMLSEYAHIRAIDEDLGARSEVAEFDWQAAVSLEGAYEAWANQAEAVLKRVNRLRRLGVAIPRSIELNDHVQRTRAILHVSLDELDAASDKLRRGLGIPGEEVRRELLARVRA